MTAPKHPAKNRPPGRPRNPAAETVRLTVRVPAALAASVDAAAAADERPRDQWVRRVLERACREER